MTEGKTNGGGETSRIEHLNAVLRAIRNVNQLVTRATSREELLPGACECLTETRGYFNAWIAEFDAQGQVRGCYESGLGEAFQPMDERLRAGEFTRCGRLALESDGVVALADPPTECVDCPLAPAYEGRAALTVAARHEGRVRALLSVSVPKRFHDDAEERGLLDEIAGDLAYALDALEERESRQQAEERLWLCESMFETVAHPMSIVGRDFRYVIANRVYAELFDCRPDEIEGRLVRELCGEGVFEREIRPRLERCFGGEDVTYEVWMDFPGRGRRLMEMSYFPYYGPEGGIIGAVTHGTDQTERERAESARMLADREKAVVLDATNEMFAFYRDNLQISLANRAAAESVGLTVDELVGQYCYEAWHGRSEPCEGCPVLAAMKSGQPEETEKLVPDGRTYSIRAFPVRDERGALLGVAEFGTDVTQHRAAEAAVRDSEARYRALAESFPHGALFWFDRELRYLYCDGRGLQDVGLRKEEIIGKTVREVFPPEVCEVVEPACRAVFDGQAGRYEVEYQGRLYENHAFPIVGADGSVTEGAVISTEITERRRAERALRESEERFRELFENMTSGVAVYEPIDDGADFVFKDMNRAGEEISGVRGEDVVGRRLSEVFPGAGQYGLPAALREAWHTGEPQFLPMSEYRDERLAQWVENTVFRLPTGEVIAVYDDRSEQRKLEEQLLQSQKMEAIGQLAGGVAHDFNNILTAILGNIDLAQLSMNEGRLDEAELRGDLDQIQQGAQRAAALTRQLLAFSRRQVTQPRLLDLNQTIADLGKMLRRLLSENIDVEFVAGRNLKAVYADPGQIEQVIVNLVVNARDAMPEGGKLTIETTNVELEDEYIRTHTEAKGGPHVMIAVSDTGCGMDAATLKRIWEPFYTTKGPGRGTGLGLATVYGIVKQARGHVMVYSEGGRGSTFKIYLPAVMEEAEADDDLIGEGEGGLRGDELVLVCEDDQAVRQLTEQMLGSAGYAVLSSSSGAEALALVEAEERTVDLLITDVIMPDMNGRQLAEALGLRGHRPAVLYVSGYTSNVIAHHGVLDEGVDFLEKPFKRETLLQRVRRILAAQRS